MGYKEKHNQTEAHFFVALSYEQESRGRETGQPGRKGVWN